MAQETIDSLIKISIDSHTCRLTANWDELPHGEWTKDMTWVNHPEDSELAALSILAYRNLKVRNSENPQAIHKVWGVAEGMSLTLWDAEEPLKRKVYDISSLAILVSTMPIPRKE